ncbi:MAG: hypothetical protein HWQ35_00780 [Nostoc sp. NMS1]|uniref:hypothetical protein n=1 Tax=unclassified Nostoc TaxID=2593658 RepID=UPI0025DA6864|nr:MULTISPECIES: hypothetical protein [unclassified Nostoc]MBN3905159.1 hypothetical protein [Nostoc sp. NMS1]MBN3989642.1 hypothetical protein [Nostoc sp. NMS2]
MTASVCYNTNNESSGPHVMLDEETYNAIKSIANRLNISLDELLARVIEYLRVEQETTEHLERQLIEILAR